MTLERAASSKAIDYLLNKRWTFEAFYLASRPCRDFQELHRAFLASEKNYFKPSFGIQSLSSRRSFWWPNVSELWSELFFKNVLRAIQLPFTERPNDCWGGRNHLNWFSFEFFAKQLKIRFSREIFLTKTFHQERHVHRGSAYNLRENRSEIQWISDWSERLTFPPNETGSS